MSENTSTVASSELDLDAWLAGGSRNTQIVKLYARNDLYAEIQELTAQLLPEKTDEAPSPDASLADANDARAHNLGINDRIENLWVELAASVKEFRVAGRTEEETRDIKAAVDKDLKDQLDTAAAAGREVGKIRAARMGVKAPDELNRFIRAGALEAVDAIRNTEIAARTIAESTTIFVDHEWHQVTPAQVLNLYKVLGEAQVDLLARAASRTAHEVPGTLLPKS